MTTTATQSPRPPYWCVAGIMGLSANRAELLPTAVETCADALRMTEGDLMDAMLADAEVRGRVARLIEREVAA